MERASERAAKRQLAGVIESSRHEIVRRWLDRLREDDSVTAIPPTELQDALPDYLDHLRNELRDGGADEVDGAAWRMAVQEHAVTRASLHLDVRQVVHEFIVLRQVLSAVAVEKGATECTPVIASAVEAAIELSVQTYVEAREEEARRLQAASVGFLTHELRSPLNTAILAAEEIRGVSGGEHSNLHAMLDRNLQRLRNEIDGVLEVAKKEAENAECRPAKTTLGDVISDTLEDATEQAQHKGLELEARFDPDVEVELDPALTRTALSNLLDNAVKYTEQGRIEVAVEATTDALGFHVRDTCPGISDEDLANIFEPFHRGHTAEKGTGLGLCIARRAAALQGGTLQAESPEPRGCHFWLTLPRKVRPRRSRP